MTERRDDEQRLAGRIDAWLRSEIGSTDAHAVARRAAQGSGPPPGWRRWAAVATVAAVVLVATVLTAGALQLVPTGASPHPSPTAAAETSATPGPSATSSGNPVPSTPWTSLTWSAPVVTSVDIQDLVEWHGEYLGVGQTSEGGNPAGLVATSTDGTHWTPVATQPTLSNGLRRIGALPNALVAVGSLELPAGCPQGEGAVCTPAASAPVWYSTDARHWTEVPPGVFGQAYPVGLATDARGALLAGETVTGDPVLWFSADGQHWQRVTLSSVFDRAVIRSVAATSGGFVLAGGVGEPDPVSIGGAAGPEGVRTPAAWWSSDGLTWQRSTVEGVVPAPGGDFGPVDVGGAGLFALVSDNPDPSKPTAGALAWASSDGRTWHKEGAVLAPVPYSTQTASDGHYIVKLGPLTPFGVGNSDTLAAWMSINGVNWNKMPLLGPASDMPAGASGPSAAKAQMRQIFVVSNGLIVLGSKGSDLLSWFVDATGVVGLPSPTPSAASWSPDTVAAWSGGMNGLVAGTQDGAGRVDRTTNGGTTWSTVWRPTNPVVNLQAFGTTNAIAVTCPSSSSTDCTLWASTHGGESWTQMGASPAAVSFADLQHGWRLVPEPPPAGTAVGGPGTAGIQRTSDGGRTWQDAGPAPCRPGQPTAMGPTAIAARTPTSAWVLCTAGPATIDEDKTVAVTTDGGNSWQVRAVVAGGEPSLDVGSIPLSGHPSGMAVTSDGTAWMWGGRMLPTISHDGGRTWTEMALGEIDVNSVIWGAPLDAQAGWALLWRSNLQAIQLEVTADGGATWTATFRWPFPPATG